MDKIIEKIRINLANVVLISFSILSLILSIFFLISCDYQSSANFFAAFGALVASVVTLRVARSADDTAKNSLIISESMRDLEIKSESAHLRITNLYVLNGGVGFPQIVINVRNFGTSAAFDCMIQNDYFENTDLVSLPYVVPHNTNADDRVGTNIYCKIKKDIIEIGFDGDYLLTYSTIFGHKFGLEFSITKNKDDNRGYYIINSQKLILEK